MGTKDDIVTYITNINPDFAIHSSLDFFVNQVINELNENSLQSLYIPACSYLVCHKLSVINLYKSGASGTISKEKLGDQEIQYNSSSNKSGNNFTTGYYQEYLNIINNIFGGFVV